PHGHVLPHSYPLLARRQPPLSTPFPYTTLFRSAARPAFRNKRSLTLWFMSTRKKRMPLRAAFWFGKYENPDGMDVGQPLPVSKLGSNTALPPTALTDTSRSSLMLALFPPTSADRPESCWPAALMLPSISCSALVSSALTVLLLALPAIAAVRVASCPVWASTVSSTSLAPLVACVTLCAVGRPRVPVGIRPSIAS